MSGPLLSFTIPGNPGDGAVNAVWRSRVVPARGKKPATVSTYKSDKGKAFAALAHRRCVAAFAAKYGTHGDVPAEISVVIRCHWPRKRHLDGTTTLPFGDVDACIKAVLDSLEDAGLVDDDARVRRVSCEKYLDKDNPRIEVEVWPVEVRP